MRLGEERCRLNRAGEGSGSTRLFREFLSMEASRSGKIVPCHEGAIGTFSTDLGTDGSSGNAAVTGKVTGCLRVRLNSAVRGRERREWSVG